MRVYFRDFCYTHFCESFGVNLYHVHGLEPLFKAKVNTGVGDHLILQLHSVQNWTSPNLHNDWLAPEEYFVDWKHSSLVQDLDVIEKILDQTFINVEGPDNESYSTNPMESLFVLRVIARKVYEKHLQNPACGDNLHQEYTDSVQRAVSELKEALGKDRIARRDDPNIKLNHFTQCNYAQSIILKNSAKMIALLACAVGIMFFFSGLYPSPRVLGWTILK